MPTEWKKAKASNGGGSCVELRNDLAAIRDSKNVDGETLNVQVRALVNWVEDSRVD